MGTPAVGDVVLIAFPYSDLSNRKLRPGLVVGVAERDEPIVCQITSRPYSSNGAIQILEADFVDGSLDRVSYARPDKLFTASPRIIQRRLGSLSTLKTAAVRKIVAALFA